jgi:hypothetical protein
MPRLSSVHGSSIAVLLSLSEAVVMPFSAASLPHSSHAEVTALERPKDATKLRLSIEPSLLGLGSHHVPLSKLIQLTGSLALLPTIKSAFIRSNRVVNLFKRFAYSR